jgi:hypothetical protein
LTNLDILLDLTDGLSRKTVLQFAQTHRAYKAALNLLRFLADFALLPEFKLQTDGGSNVISEMFTFKR